MSKLEKIDQFLGLKNLAFVGVSRNDKKFSNMFFKSMKSKGYNLYPVHQSMDAIDGIPCLKSIDQTKGRVEGVVVVTNKNYAKTALKEALDADIRNVWLQMGSDDQSSRDFIKEHNLNAVTGECMLMFTDKQKFPHNVHRWVKVNLTGFKEK